MPPSWLRSLQEHASSSLGGGGAGGLSGARVPASLENADWSAGLGPGLGAGLFSEGLLQGLVLPGEACVMAVEPLMGYLAVGTTAGTLHLYGAPPVQLSLTLRPSLKPKHLAFKPGTGLLICVDIKDNLSIYDLARPDPTIRATAFANPHASSSASFGSAQHGPPHPDTPLRIAVHSVRNVVMCIELSPSFDHLFLGLRDGTVDTYDLDRFCVSPYRVPNLWWEEEEILRKSGVPGAPSRRHVPLLVDMRVHPKDLNQLLLAYEGGVVLLDIKERAVLHTYQMHLVPGAPGAGGDVGLNTTERTPPVTCIAWRPDGEVFAVGHEDGCVSFWHIHDDERPLMVRTLDALDVDKPQPLMSHEQPMPGRPMMREPVFKLSWSGFPERSWLDMAAGATQAADADSQEQQPTKGTIVTILGGALIDQDAPGLCCLHFPPYTPPMWSSSTSDAVAKLRHQLRQSLATTNESRYITDTTVEDFMLVPRNNPHYSLSWDPIAVIALVASDPTLPPLPPPAASRGLCAYVFPQRTSATTRPGTLQVSSPTFSPASPSSGTSALPHPPTTLQKTLSLPLSLSFTGSGALLGAKLETLSVQAYRKLVGALDVTGARGGMGAELASDAVVASEGMGQVCLRGGKASPIVTGGGIDGPEALAKSSKFRILITWHLDGTVRVHDASPHLLLLGKLGAALPEADEEPPLFLERAFPSPLPHLTISTRALLYEPSMGGHPTFARLVADPTRLKVTDVHLAKEVLELAIVLRSGQVLHYRFDYARPSETAALNREVAREVEQDEAAAAALASPLSPRSRTSEQAAAPPVSELDEVMANAMQELGTGPAGPSMSGSGPNAAMSPAMAPQMSSQSMHSRSSSSVSGGPPPRPRRDPRHRLSMLGRPPSRDTSASVSPVGVEGVQESGGFKPSPDLSPQSRMAPPPQPRIETSVAPRPSHSATDELTHIGHLAAWNTDGFKPHLMIELQRGEVTACTASDIGFLAIACGTALAVVDMRGPELLLRDGFGDEVGHQGLESREARKAAEAENSSPIAHLTFSVCRVADDASLAPRLIALRTSGLTTIWTLSRTLGQWFATRTSAVRIEEIARPMAAFVTDLAANMCFASPPELQRSMREQQSGAHGLLADGSAPPDFSLLVGFSEQMITVRFGITGARLAKTDVGERMLGAAIVERHGERVAVGVTNSSVRIFSLPQLEPIVRLQRHHREQGDQLGILAQINLDDHGDFVEVASSLDVRFWTMFGGLPRAGQPALRLNTSVSLPAHPGAGVVAAGIAGLFGSRNAYTVGAALDEILAGPKRPPRPNLPDALPHASAAAQKRATRYDPNRAVQEAQRRREERERVLAQNGDTRMVVEDNVEALKQRGDMMNSLEQSFGNLERGASDFVARSKRLAVQAAAKNSVKSWFL